MLALLGAVTFVGAALLFLLEPMLAKLVLPPFGGSPMVWNTATLFFQVVLLAGYGYVHLATTRLGPRRQPWLHVGLLAGSLLALPVVLPGDADPPPGTEPVWWLLRVLVLAAGVPFALLATTGPLLQRWLSWSGHSRGRDPYVLYAASNAGSLVGLLGYPFLLEPWLGLATLTRWWSWAYAVAAVLSILLAVAVARAARRVGSEPGPEPEPDAVAGGVPREAVPAARRLRWVALAFLPSSLMLGVTTHVTTDIAAMPLFWTVPLAVYLATFVVAFARTSRQPPRLPAYLAAALAIAVLLVALGAWRPPVWGSIALDLAMLACVGVAAHGRLAADRPAPERLTGFYLLISLGGALGGALNGLVAPVVLDRPWEFPVTLALVPLVAVGLAAPRLRPSPVSSSGAPVPPRRGRLQPLVLVTVILLGGVAVQDLGATDVMARERTFFGSYKITETPDRRALVHGTTVHGTEVLRGPDAGTPTTYYARSGPIGDVMSAYAGTPVLDRVALVGLGVGTLAAYGREGQRLDFYEIDPAVVDLARTWFGYLERSPARVRVRLGDARLRLEEAGGAYGMVVLDAFTSDAIPVHLLTVEAMRTYVRRLAPGGIVAVHISNRHLELAPVVAAVGERAGLVALTRQDGSALGAALPSTWVVLARDGADLTPLRGIDGWEPQRANGVTAWTDDHSSLVSVLDLG